MTYALVFQAARASRQFKLFAKSVRRLPDPSGEDYSRWAKLCQAEVYRIMVDPTIVPWDMLSYEYLVTRLVCVESIASYSGDQWQAVASLANRLEDELIWRLACCVPIIQARSR